uniref:Uncharacterized protein n=1 Tax=Arundo donax TaxID=35708 RepID=A0A0A9EB80_ARUDO
MQRKHDIFTVVPSHQLWWAHYTTWPRKHETTVQTAQSCSCKICTGWPVLSGHLKSPPAAGAHHHIITLAARLPGWEGRSAEAS